MSDTPTSGLNRRLETAAQNQLEEAKAVLQQSGEIPARKTDLTDDIEVITKDGEKLTLGELKLGYLRQKDYTQKTMALSEERKTIGTENNELKQYVEAVNEFMKAKPDVYQKMVKYYEEGDEDTAPKQSKYRNPEYDERLQRHEKELEDLKKQRQLAAVDKAVIDLRTEHPELNETEMNLILKIAHGGYDRSKSLLDNLKEAYSEVKGTVDRGVKSVEESARAKLGARFMGGSGQGKSNSASEEELFKKSGLFNPAANEILGA